MFCHVDLIQHRYGWDDQQVLKLPLMRFMQIAASLETLKERETLERWQQFAFSAWLLGPNQQISFQEFLENLALVRLQSLKPTSLEQVKKEAEDTASRVLAAFQQGAKLYVE